MKQSAGKKGRGNQKKMPRMIHKAGIDRLRPLVAESSGLAAGQLPPEIQLFRGPKSGMVGPDYVQAAG